MGKIVFWLVIIFALLVALRLWNAAKSRARDREATPQPGPRALPMVRCGECGVFLPRADTKMDGDVYRCTDAKCPNRRRS